MWWPETPHFASGRVRVTYRSSTAWLRQIATIFVKENLFYLHLQALL